jgi:hypothetical protein
LGQDDVQVGLLELAAHRPRYAAGATNDHGWEDMAQSGNSIGGKHDKRRIDS